MKFRFYHKIKEKRVLSLHCLCGLQSPESWFWGDRVGARLKRLIFGNRGILVYNICLISISNSVSDGTTNKSVLNIESS